MQTINLCVLLPEWSREYGKSTLSENWTGLATVTVNVALNTLKVNSPLGVKWH